MPFLLVVKEAMAGFAPARIAILMGWFDCGLLFFAKGSRMLLTALGYTFFPCPMIDRGKKMLLL